jgi:diguanylate cyclase (GGDEF)-like protein
MNEAHQFSPAQLQALLAALPDPAFVITRSGRYAAAYGGADLRYYHDGSALVGRAMDEVLNADKAAWFKQQIEAALLSRQLHVVEYGLAGSDVKGLQPQGPEHTIWFEGRVQALNHPVHGEDAVLWVASNITERHEMQQRLRLQSETDELTGLHNRRKLMAALQEHHDVVRRYHTPTALLIFDIDGFKRINDQHGHHGGDMAIIATAEVCRAELRTTDLIARLGGDEFVVLMPHVDSRQAAASAERLRQRVAQALHGLGHIKTSISGGLSELRTDDASGEVALRRADDALFRAKRSGRNRIVSA